MLKELQQQDIFTALMSTMTECTYSVDLAQKNLADLKSFHFPSEKWQDVETTKSISPRRGHQSLIYDHYLIIHGGRNNTEPSNDLQFFDFDTNTWETVKVDATAPTPRYFHSLGFWQNTILVFGGLGVIRNNPPLDKNGKIKNRNLNDLYSFSFRGNVFSDIHSINGRFSVMPLDVLKYCLEYFDQISLARLSRVNRFFYFVSSADYLWKRQLYNKTKSDSWLTNSSLMKDIENGRKALQTQTTNSNNNNTAASVDGWRLDDLLAMLQSKMKPDIRQFYWKYQYVDRIVGRNGFSWKPQRDPRKMQAGIDTFLAGSAPEMKLVIMGGGGVGKSTTLIQYIQNHFVEEYDPTIEDTYRKQIRMPGTDKPMLVDILDTAGPEEYSAMRDQYMRTGQGFIIMYSVNSHSSFDEAQDFLERIMRTKDSDHWDIPIVIVGNKCDLTDQRQVIAQEGLEFAQRYDVPFFEASAKLRVNTTQQFEELVREVAYKYYAKNVLVTKKKDKCIIQ
mmetsp:Transcript_1956/g.2548  ORF Transcript_1956/g.2548 Transcript_1956/m.2548 type:complete len:505 (+) Transcript_1956:675-2189(+)